MNAHANKPADAPERNPEEAETVARQLAEYGFYVVDKLLPEDVRPKQSRPPKRVT